MTSSYYHKLSLRAEHSVDSWNTTELPPWVDPTNPPSGPPGSPYPPWPPEDFCADFVSRLKIHAASVIEPDTCVGLSASGGVPPYTFSIVSQSGGHYWLDGNQICADATACGSVTIRVTDACLYTADHDLVAPAGQWGNITYGCAPSFQIIHPDPDPALFMSTWKDILWYQGYPSSPGEQVMNGIVAQRTYGKYKQYQNAVHWGTTSCIIPYGTIGGYGDCNCEWMKAYSEPIARIRLACTPEESTFECACRARSQYTGGYCGECMNDDYFYEGVRASISMDNTDGICHWYDAGYGYYFMWGIPRYWTLYYREWEC